MNRSLFSICVLILAASNLGTVRHTEDPIRDTQTNPILYEQKKEEEKDGKKGPLMYHVRNNPREAFFIDPPYEAEKKVLDGEILTGGSVAADASGWWEEQPAGPQTEPSVDAVSEPLPESLPQEERARDLEAPEQPAAEPEAGNAPAGKSGDYWW